jgi:hypothetical protein
MTEGRAGRPAQPDRLTAEKAAQLSRQAEVLRTRERELEQRQQQLDQAARDQAFDRETLDREFGELQARVERSEKELTLRQAEVEEETRTRWQQCQERCAAAAEALARHLQEQAAEGNEAAVRHAEQERRQQRRRQELDSYARYLERVRRQLAEREAQLALGWQEFQRRREEAECAAEPAATPAPLPAEVARHLEVAGLNVRWQQPHTMAARVSAR